jgi:hypothetical protein
VAAYVGVFNVLLSELKIYEVYVHLLVLLTSLLTFNTLKSIRLGKEEKSKYTGPYNRPIFRTGKYNRLEADTLLPDHLLHNVVSI